MAFDKGTRNRGRFDYSKPLVAAIGFRGMQSGDTVVHGSRSKRAEWWRRGWVQYAEHADQVEEKQETAPTEDKQLASDVETGEEVEAVSAEEGDRGWWVVTFSDGSIKKMRFAAVEELGLVDVEDGE